MAGNIHRKSIAFLVSLSLVTIGSCKASQYSLTVVNNHAIEYGYQEKKTDPLDCIVTACSNRHICTVSYNMETGKCRQGVYGNERSQNDPKSKWITYTRENDVFSSAVVFMAFNDYFRDRLGDSTPFKCLQWNGKGKVNESGFASAFFPENCKVSLNAANDYKNIGNLFGSKGEFTIAFWEKGTSGLESYPCIMQFFKGNRTLMDVRFHPSNIQAILKLRVTTPKSYKEVYTNKNYQDLDRWRHFAVVFKKGTVKFYRNSEPWSIFANWSTPPTMIDHPDRIVLGDDKFVSSLACLAIYNSALGQQYIKTVMESCM